MSRKEGGEGLIYIEDCSELAMRRLKVYNHSTDERLIQTASGNKINGLEATSILKTKKKRRLEVRRSVF